MSQQPNPCPEVSVGPDGGPGPRSPGENRLLRLLEERLRFESLLSRLSATFVHLPADKVDEQIQSGLQQIVEFLGVERSSVAQFSEDGSELVATHSYTIPGFPPMPRVNLAAMWPWYTAKVRQGHVLRFTRLPDELPPEAVPERQYVLHSGMRSHLAVPFKVGQTLLGGFGVATFVRQRDWPDDLVRSLELIGEVFANALARKRADLVLRESEGRFRRMADALRENEARFRLLLESTNAIPWVADAVSWRITYVGPQAPRLLGYPIDAWYEEGFWQEHIHPDDRDAAVAFCREHSGQDSDFELEYRMLAADGRSVWLHDVVHVVAENGMPKELRGFLIDITARRQAEDESRALRDQLARVGRVSTMGELAASIAHEVNQPLCAIVSNAQAAQRLLGSQHLDLDEVRLAMQDVIQDGQRASAVIARIRGFLQQAAPERVRLDINELIREVWALMHAELSRKGVAVRLELADGLPSVLGDRVQLQQVILNLVANGADARNEAANHAPELLLRSTADEAGRIAVAVSDNGVGLDPANIDRVFEAFVTSKPGRLGMGLAISKSIVAAHGGRIWASRNTGPGSTFRFTLPGLAGE